MRNHTTRQPELDLAIVAGLVIALSGTPTAAAAQGGHGVRGCSVVEQLDCTLLYRDAGFGDRQRSWPTAIVLRRMPPDSAHQRDSAAVAREADTESRLRTLRRATEDAGWNFMGGRQGPVIWDFAVDPDQSRVRLGGRVFQVPLRDSTLVIMVEVTQDSAYTPVIVGEAYVPAQLPADYWQKMWRSGDTLFVVHPRNTDEMLTRLLRTNPSIAAYLDGS